MRALRGAITVERNDRQEILDATSELLQQLTAANALAEAQVVSVIFTMTGDLDAEFPAVAARQLGWTQVPLLCCREISVPGSLPHCIRVLMHVETGRPRAELHHVYLREAVKLRPDLSVPQ